MDKKCIKFDPWLLGAIEKSMGHLPLMPNDLDKIKSLFFYSTNIYCGEPGTILNGWIEISIGDYSAIGKMHNLHTILFQNYAALRIHDFSFLLTCPKIKKLDLSSTDFSDCSILAKLPALKYVLLPDRRRLIHTEVLEQIKAKSETKQPKHLEEPFNPEAGFTDITFKPTLPKLTNSKSNSKTKENTNDSFYRDDEFDYMTVIRGEDVTISYEGSSKVRHIIIEFWDYDIPDILKIFNQDTENNYANLSPDDAKCVNLAITDAIINGYIKTLYMSLDAWGEDALLGLEFGGWVTITYDDTTTDTDYWSYNPAYTSASELSPVDIGGQTPVPKMMAFEDFELAAKIAKHFLETGQLLPGTLWKTTKKVPQPT